MADEKVPRGGLKWLSLDVDMHRAKVLKESGYCLWMAEPELDGWWIIKAHCKQNRCVPLTEDEAVKIAGGRIEPGECLRLEKNVPLAAFADRALSCSAEMRLEQSTRRPAGPSSF